MKEVKAVIFDIDGTLSPEISWLSLTRELGASNDEHIAIYQAYRSGNTTYIESRDSLLQLWQSTGNATKPFIQSVFENIPLIDRASDVVATIQERYRVCIITGSMDMYAQMVAAKLNVSDYFANTKLFWDENNKLLAMDYELNQAERKLEQFLGYCSVNNIKPTECIVVGDSENDVELFKASGKGVAVGNNIPDALLKVALHSAINIMELPQFIAS